MARDIHLALICGRTCPDHCSQHAACGACGGDLACGWCPSIGKCLSRTEDATCADTVDYVGECLSTCAVQNTCATCSQKATCGWCGWGLSDIARHVTGYHEEEDAKGELEEEEEEETEEEEEKEEEEQAHP